MDNCRFSSKFTHSICRRPVFPLKKERKNGYRTHGSGFCRELYSGQSGFSPAPITLLTSLHGFRGSESIPVGFHPFLPIGKNSQGLWKRAVNGHFLVLIPGVTPAAGGSQWTILGRKSQRGLDLRASGIFSIFKR
jgi:hypothetical protein